MSATLIFLAGVGCFYAQRPYLGVFCCIVAIGVML